MEVRRTVPVTLDVGSTDAALLRETVDESLWAANCVVDHAWQGEYKTTSKAQLQVETYDDVREQTRLHANLVQDARNRLPTPYRASSLGGNRVSTQGNHTFRSRP